MTDDGNYEMRVKAAGEAVRGNRARCAAFVLCGHILRWIHSLHQSHGRGGFLGQ